MSSKNIQTYDHLDWLNNLAAATFVINANREVIFWNHACEVLTGVKSETVFATNKHWMGFYTHERQCLADLVLDDNWETNAHLYSHIKKASTTDRGLLAENWCQTPAGNKYLIFEANALFDNDKQLFGAIETLRDATDLKQMESELNLAQKLEAVGQLAAGIAHEINTPAQYVCDNIQFINDGFTDLANILAKLHAFIKNAKDHNISEDQIKQLEEAIQVSDLEYLLEEFPQAISQSQQGIGHISNIVRAMKEFSHPGNNDKEPVDINHIIKNTVIVTKNEWKYVSEIKLELDKKLPLVPCYTQAISQVIMNLIVNAAHAITDVVDSNNNEKGSIIISTCKLNEEVEIKISDSGAGIPDDIKKKIFDPFFTTKGVGRGTGQGLAIARSAIIDKHKGTIKCDSEVGKGTTFIICLPIIELDADITEDAA